MSSHHIIREKQEPALLILDIASFDQELLGQLLEWSPTVIVAEEVYDHVYSLGIKIDVVLKQSDAILNIQEHVKVIDLKGTTNLQSTLDFLIKEEYPSVNIITNKFVEQDYINYVNKIDLVVFIDTVKIFPIKSGFSKWKSKGEIISILSDDMELNLIEGLKSIGKNKYETMKDGLYRLSFTNNFIFIGEEV